MLRVATEKICWDWLRSSAENGCWEDLLRVAAENGCAEKSCWELLRSGADSGSWEWLWNKISWKISSSFYAGWVWLIPTQDNPLVTSWSSDAQNCGEIRILRMSLVTLFSRHLSDVQNYGGILTKKKAFRHSFVPPTRLILREGSSSTSKMCVSLQRRAIQNFEMHDLLRWRAQKCMIPALYLLGPQHIKRSILPGFRTSDQHEVRRGLRGQTRSLRFTTVLDSGSARNDERIARVNAKFAMHHSFGRPISTKRREGVLATWKLGIAPQFWTSDDHEITRGLRGTCAKFKSWRQHRAKRSFWKHCAENLDGTSYAMLVLEAYSVKFGSSLARNEFFGFFSVKLVRSIIRNARFGCLFCANWSKPPAKPSF